jgi:hypothetical protein
MTSKNIPDGFITIDELIETMCKDDPEFRKLLEEERILLHEELAEIKRNNGN